VLVERFPETVETQPELLAQHYTEAGLSEQAIAYWQRAGQRASERSAHLEAIAHLTKGLEMLNLLPNTPERTQHELDLQLTLGPALMVTKGWADPEVERVYTRVHSLCQQIGEPPQLFPALWGLWLFYAARGELQPARELGEQLLVLAERVQEPMMLVQAYHALGPTLFWLGELAPAQALLAQGLACYDPQQHRANLRYGGHDAGWCCRNYAAWTLWALGYPDQALHQEQEALRLAQALAHPATLVNALDFAAWLHQFRREGPAAQAQAEAAMPMASEHGFVQWLAEEKVLRGWALAAQGQGEAGIAQMREGLATWKAIRVELYRTYQLLQLAEVYGAVGQAEEGLRVLAEARAAVPREEGRFFEAELSRLEGELLLARAAEHYAEAEACFHQALAIARRQQAKSWELRAATSLARLYQCQGKRAEAHELLAPVYGWFTEGFDTADLQEAKALLAELA
jgi:predicted ATPase